MIKKHPYTFDTGAAGTRLIFGLLTLISTILYFKLKPYLQFEFWEGSPSLVIAAKEFMTFILILYAFYVIFETILWRLRIVRSVFSLLAVNIPVYIGGRYEGEITFLDQGTEERGTSKIAINIFQTWRSIQISFSDINEEKNTAEGSYSYMAFIEYSEELKCVKVRFGYLYEGTKLVTGGGLSSIKVNGVTTLTLRSSSYGWEVLGGYYSEEGGSGKVVAKTVR